MHLNKSFLKTFYYFLTEEELPIEVSNVSSALPDSVTDKNLDVDLLNLCKKCLYINFKQMPDDKKTTLIKLKSTAISYSNVYSIINQLEQIVIKLGGNYQPKFLNLGSKKYNNEEKIIELAILARKCLFADDNLDAENSGDYNKEFSSFLTKKIENINQDNVDEVRKALEELCDVVD